LVELQPLRCDPMRDDRNVVLISANPKAGSRFRERHLQELIIWLRDHGLHVELSSDLNHTEARAEQLHRAGRLRALVAAGGDGTLAELANRTEPSTPIAIYPLGTANLVARYVGAGIAVEPFGRMLLDAATVRFDAGRANGRLFLAVCSCGFDAEVVRQVHEARTGHISMFAYLPSILASLKEYQFPELHVHCDSESTAIAPPISARFAFVSNLPCYAGGLKPGAGAIGDDGLLDLCTLAKGSFWHTLRYLPYMFSGTQRDLAACTMLRATKFRIESTVPVPYELDGDAGGFLPVEIDILPGRLTLIVPRAFGK
jgi:diacylglycerol kinase (ATP)